SLAVRTLRLLLLGSALVAEFRARLKLRATLNTWHGLRRNFELRAALIAELDSASVGRTALRTLDGRSTDATTALLLLRLIHGVRHLPCHLVADSEASAESCADASATRRIV